MSAFTAINLEQLPAPQIVETLSFEQIKTEMLADFRSRYPDYTAIVESDPAYKLIEVAAYRELLLRARINDAAKGVMLAYAQGNDLEHLAALYGVTRQVVDAGNPTARPPVPPTYETDTRLRHRTQLALEGFTTAGSEGSYVFWGLSASGHVKDIDVVSPSPGEVTVTVLSTLADGTADNSLIETVYAALNADEIRPLTDRLTVQSAAITHYSVDATLYFYRGPDVDTVKALAESKLREYVTTHHLLGHDITISGLHAALHQIGVQNVVLHSPLQDIVIDKQQSAFCEQILLTVGGIDE